jgi:hypothetical protein
MASWNSDGNGGAATNSFVFNPLEVAVPSMCGPHLEQQGTYLSQNRLVPLAATIRGGGGWEELFGNTNSTTTNEGEASCGTQTATLLANPQLFVSKSVFAQQPHQRAWSA